MLPFTNAGILAQSGSFVPIVMIVTYANKFLLICISRIQTGTSYCGIVWTMALTRVASFQN